MQKTWFLEESTTVIAKMYAIEIGCPTSYRNMHSSHFNEMSSMRMIDESFSKQ